MSWRGHFPPLPVPTPIRPNACIPAYPQISTIYLNHHLGENCIAHIKLAPHTDFPHLFRKLMGASSFPKGSMRTFAQGACMPRGHKISARVGGGRGATKRAFFREIVGGILHEQFKLRKRPHPPTQQLPATGKWVTKTFFWHKGPPTARPCYNTARGEGRPPSPCLPPANSDCGGAIPTFLWEFAG